MTDLSPYFSEQPGDHETRQCAVVRTLKMKLIGSRAAAKEYHALRNSIRLASRHRGSKQLRRGGMWVRRARLWAAKCEGEKSTIKFMTFHMRRTRLRPHGAPV